LSGAEIAKALASYVRSITSGNSRFDRFIAGDAHALSEEEQLGLKTFRTKGNCVTCHIGPTFTDEQLHNTGVSWRANSSGGGRFRDVGAGRGDFKTPTLRDLARTAPYMHDGTLSTLGAVIDFYDRGGRPNPYLDPEIRPRRFTAQEKAALEAFLRALSGEISS
jgi:cytochrome c peroxidase